MSIRKKPGIFKSTGRTLDLNRNILGQLTSIIITKPDFEFSEHDIDSMIEYMAEGNIFPVHRVLEIENQDEQPQYKKSKQDFSFRTYKGKNIQLIKYDFRLDYHQLLRQFEGQKLRVIYCLNNNSLLAVKNGLNYSGFLMSDFTVEDIDLFATNLSPLRIELDIKDEINLMEHIKLDYLITEIDRRIVNIEANVQSTSVNLFITYLGIGISSFISSDMSISDINGFTSFNFTNNGGGGYLLNGLSSDLIQGCINILSEIFVGNVKYSISVAITYHVLEHFESGDYDFFESEKYELFNT
jgi:hypothetical protein